MATTARANQDRIARDEACDAVFDDMTELVLEFVTETGLLTPDDLRAALNEAIATFAE